MMEAGLDLDFYELQFDVMLDDDDVILALEELLEDVETVLEDNDPLTYTDSTGASQSTVQTTIGNSRYR